MILGYNTIGGSTNTLTNWFVGSGFDLSSNMTATDFYFYGNANSGTATFDVAVYQETSLNNYTFVGNAISTASVGSTPTWNHFSLNNLSLTAGNRYYLAIWTASAFTFYFDAAPANTTYATTGNTFNIWPSPENGGITDAAKLSLYISDTPPVPPTATISWLAA